MQEKQQWKGGSVERQCNKNVRDTETGKQLFSEKHPGA